MNQPVQGKLGRYWHLLEDGRIQCDVCPRYCKLHDGQRGLCFVRARQGDQMVLTTYGRSSGFCVDPIEKKPLNHFLPGTPVLSFGTAGCNLTCKFCQNWDISKAQTLDRIQDLALPEAIADAAVQSGCRSVAFTYNDPVIFLEYAVDVAQACHERGIKTVAVSAGYISPEPRAEFFRHMDAANIDLKGFTEGFYKNLCSGKLAPVLETLE
ncbi:MAG: AmmeMemoRadiSam system radical SAM enzyme, partial [Pseudolabrys sp.]